MEQSARICCFGYFCSVNGFKNTLHAHFKAACEMMYCGVSLISFMILLLYLLNLHVTKLYHSTESRGETVKAMIVGI